MRLNKETVISRLKAGESLIDNGIQVRFPDGSQCNVFTYWKLRDAGDIKPIYPEPSEEGVYRKWYWDVVDKKAKELHSKLSGCLNSVKLGTAGRVLYYDVEAKCFILAMHTTGPEKTQEAMDIALNSLPSDLIEELKAGGYGFAGKQI